MKHSDVFKLSNPVIKTLIQCIVLAGIVIVSIHPAEAQFATSGSDIYNTNAGNVGIGTSTPGSKLEVYGDATVQGIVWSAGSTASIVAADRSASGIGVFYRNGGVNAFWDNTAGNVISYNSSGNTGIGTIGQDRVLVVSGAAVADLDSKSQVKIESTAAYNAAPTAGLSFGVLYSSGGSLAYGTSIQGYKENATDGNFAQGLRFTTQANGNSPTTRMTIAASGNVGIGTTSPSSALDVAGDVTVSGNISAKYQDLAEWVPTTQTLSAGTVVALDTETDNGVIRSSVPYDTHVAGVVSASPGIVLGQARQGDVKIATTGRVKVRVDTSNGPIRRGDLLVTSTKEGTAMRSEPIDVGGSKIHRPGTLIGKALEPLPDGEGEILVLLSLQ